MFDGSLGSGPAVRQGPGLPTRPPGAGRERKFYSGVGLNENGAGQRCPAPLPPPRTGPRDQFPAGASAGVDPAPGAVGAAVPGAAGTTAPGAAGVVAGAVLLAGALLEVPRRIDDGRRLPEVIMDSVKASARNIPPVHQVARVSSVVA